MITAPKGKEIKYHNSSHYKLLRFVERGECDVTDDWEQASQNSQCAEEETETHCGKETETEVTLQPEQPEKPIPSHEMEAGMKESQQPAS